jgi:hypothetical protein
VTEHGDRLRKRWEAYRICQERGHQPSGYVTASIPPWTGCRFCGTHYRMTAPEMVELDPPGPLVTLLDEDGKPVHETMLGRNGRWDQPFAVPRTGSYTTRFDYPEGARVEKEQGYTVGDRIEMTLNTGSPKGEKPTPLERATSLSEALADEVLRAVQLLPMTVSTAKPEDYDDLTMRAGVVLRRALREFRQGRHAND